MKRGSVMGKTSELALKRANREKSTHKIINEDMKRDLRQQRYAKRRRNATIFKNNFCE